MSIPLKPAPPEDLEFIIKKTFSLTPHFPLRQENILITGGTGFFGKWLTQGLLAMNDSLNLGNQLTIVTRDQSRTLNSQKWLVGRKDVKFIESDIRNLRTSEKFTSIIHGAAAASLDLNENRPLEMFETILEGTKRILEIAQNNCKRLQFISSGAVYGPQPPGITHLNEDFLGGPSPLDKGAAYAEGKRSSELMCVMQQRTLSYRLSIPRCFAFIGPYLPLDIHFAAGNFLKAVLDNQPIEIKGDGSPYRSYLYAADLTVWLLKMLVTEDDTLILNVGSDEPVTIRETAEAINRAGVSILPNRGSLTDPVRVALPPQNKISRYVPDTTAAANLGLKVWTNLEDGARKTLLWHL